MSLHTVGKNMEYILPASQSEVPECFKSNKAPKPIPCSLQTVNVPSLSGSQNASGTSIIQLPLGNSAGYMSNPYLRFTVTFANAAAVATSLFQFKGAVGSAYACINSYQTYVNSVQIDNLQSADLVADGLLAHSTSNDWVGHDGNVLMGCQQQWATGAATSWSGTFCLPILGLLGSQQSYPLFLCNGVLQIQINWNPLVRMYSYTTADPAWTSATFSNVQLVYDRISPEQAFIDSVRMSMAQGHKFIYSYSNFQSTSVATVNGQSTLNFGLNVSSLSGILATQVTTADLSATSGAGYSVPNGLSNFIVTLDGRNINANVFLYNYSTGSSVVTQTINQSVIFAELQRAIGRIFDASISDTCTQSTYNTTNFAVGVSAKRVSEGLEFTGSPVSIVGIQPTTSAAGYTMIINFMSDFQLAIDNSGSVEIIR